MQNRRHGSKIYKKITERGKGDTPYTEIHDRFLPGLGVTSMKVAELRKT